MKRCIICLKLFGHFDNGHLIMEDVLQITELWKYHVKLSSNHSVSWWTGIFCYICTSSNNQLWASYAYGTSTRRVDVMILGPIPLTIFLSQVQLSWKLAFLQFDYCSSDRHKCLHKPRHHISRVMGKCCGDQFVWIWMRVKRHFYRIRFVKKCQWNGHLLACRT